MAWKYVLLGIGMCFAGLAYWLYTPLPDGYSSASNRQIQMMLASGKVIDAVVGIVLVVFLLLCTVRSTLIL